MSRVVYIVIPFADPETPDKEILELARQAQVIMPWTGHILDNQSEERDEREVVNDINFVLIGRL